MQSTPTPLACPACKQALPAAQFLDGCSKYWAALELVHFTCPQCKGVSEAQLRPGAIHFGYTYAAGTVHFCAMLEISVPGLDLYASADELSVELESRQWAIRSE